MYDISKTLILGSGASGQAAAELIRKKGGDAVIISDTRALTLEEFVEIFESVTLTVISPGIPYDTPLSVFSRQIGVDVISELEFAYSYCPSKIIGITGTNGKSTVTAWCAHILNTEPLGNFGTPLSQKVDFYGGGVILPVEVSSFMLEGVKEFAPQVAVLLNITPDHLDRHGDIKTYAALKSRIFARAGFAVLNYDCPIVKNMKPESADTYYFSLKEKVRGAYVSNGDIFWKEERFITVAEIKLKGAHNLSNALAAASACLLAGASKDAVVGGLKTFTGIPHRFQTVGGRGGITFINDSKATNPESTITAINTLDTTAVLILGGSGKGSDFSGLFAAMRPEVAATVITGATAQNIAVAAESAGCKNTVITKTFAEAFAAAAAKAQKLPKPCAILLSPACASFDEFKNFEERGDYFCALAKRYIENGGI